MRQNALDARLIAACKVDELFYRQLKHVTEAHSALCYMLSLTALCLLLTSASGS